MKTDKSWTGTSGIASRRPSPGPLTTLDITGGPWSAVPVRAAFGIGPVHSCSTSGTFDVARAADTLRAQLVRSSFYLGGTAESDVGVWTGFAARLGERLFASIDGDSIIAWAATPEEARQTVERLRATFRIDEPPAHTTFQIVKYSCNEIETESVRICGTTPMDSGTLDLHYGDGFAAWADEFAAKLNARQTGLSIIDGPPGTGKTSFIRQLMVRLKDTHRFYFIGSANLRLLRDAEFVDFWSSQRRSHEASRMVVILEDAESALMSRCSDNRQEVSLLLNITDGILGEFLRLQVICTINCSLKDLDSALLRPGRLTAHKYFGKLARPTAARLAAHIGKPLPPGDDPLSLAEIFSAERDNVSAPSPKVGF
jgi:molybdopterin-guanine dinucleotide biosynthesis protein